MSSRSSWSPQREHRVDEVVAGALLAQLHLQPVGEEGEQVAALAPSIAQQLVAAAERSRDDAASALASRESAGRLDLAR